MVSFSYVGHIKAFSYISRKLRLFHKQLKIPCCYFNFWLLGAR